MINQSHFDNEIAAKAALVDKYVEDYFTDLKIPRGAGIDLLCESMFYSAKSGGKRFRPVLALLVAELFQTPALKILPWATAVEFVHTYSLIHDDLPCMDDDDLRRGKPTNHKVYGEAFALLAGDALLTEAFTLVAESYSGQGIVCSRLIELLARAAGIRGMVGGQAIDLQSLQSEKLGKEELMHLHKLKTGKMIQLPIVGAALLSDASSEDVENLAKFGENLGIAFQVADDILDHASDNQDQRSFVGLLGLQGTQDLLQTVSDEALSALKKLPRDSAYLEHMIVYNKTRTV